MIQWVNYFQVWSAVLLKEERYLVTGSMDQELRVWKLNWTEDIKDEEKLTRQLEIVKLEETDSTEDSSVSLTILSITLFTEL